LLAKTRSPRLLSFPTGAIVDGMTRQGVCLMLRCPLHGGRSRSLDISGSYFMCFACGVRGETKRLPHRTWLSDAANDTGGSDGRPRR